MVRRVSTRKLWSTGAASLAFDRSGERVYLEVSGSSPSGHSTRMKAINVEGNCQSGALQERHGEEQTGAQVQLDEDAAEE